MKNQLLMFTSTQIARFTPLTNPSPQQQLPQVEARLPASKPGFTFISCVTFGKWLNLSVSYFPQ